MRTLVVAGACSALALLGLFSPSAAQEPTLPALVPSSSVASSSATEKGARTPLASPAEARAAAVDSCRARLLAATRALGSVRVTASPAGSAIRGPDGSVTIPIKTRIEYGRRGGTEVRQARVACRVDAEGKVVAVQSPQRPRAHGQRQQGIGATSARARTFGDVFRIVGRRMGNGMSCVARGNCRSSRQVVEGAMGAVSVGIVGAGVGGGPGLVTGSIVGAAATANLRKRGPRWR
jgi:hypothetical protein